MKNIAELDKQKDGWYFDSGKKVTHIKVRTKKANSSFSVYVSKGSSLGN